MNSDGHILVAAIVNSVIGERFNSEFLLLGAVDTDTKNVGTYTGLEARHHHNDEAHGSGEIIAVVNSRINLARQEWLKGNKTSASFHFGVATHFYMDGFICSPTVDPEAHARGDRQFTAAVKKVRNINRNILDKTTGAKTHVSRLVACLSDNFGTNNTDVVPNAIAALCDAAVFVTDTVVARDFKKKAEDVSESLAWSIECGQNTMQRNVDRAVDRYVDTRNSRASWDREFTAALCVNKIAPRPFHFRCFDWWGIASRFGELEMMDDSIRKEAPLLDFSEELYDATQRLEKLRKAHDREGDWYSTKAAEEKIEREINRMTNTYCRYVLNYKNNKKQAMQKVRRLDSPGLRDIITRERAKDDSLVFGSDAGKKLAQMCASDPTIRLVPFAGLAVVLVLLFFAVLFGRCPYGIVAAFFLIGLYACLYALCYFRALKDLWRWRYKEKKFKCHKCKTDSTVWVNRVSGKTACPFCKHPIVLPKNDNQSYEA